MVPTSLAIGLTEPLRRLMIDIEAIISVGEEFDPLTSRRSFRLNASGYVAAVLMEPLVARVTAEAPHVVLEFVQPMPSAEALESGDVDLLIAAERYLAALHPAEVLSEEHYVVLGWVENPLLKSPISIDNFFNSSHLETRFGRAGDLSFADAQAQNLPHPRHVDARTSTFGAIPHLLVGTERLALVQDKLAKSFLQHFPLAMQPPPFLLLPVKMMIQHHISSTNDAGVIWLTDIIKDIINT